MLIQAKNILSILAVMGFLTACGTTTGQVDQTAHFDAQSKNVLILLGLDVPAYYKDLTINFRQYDPTTGKALKTEKKIKPSHRDLSSRKSFITNLTGGADMPTEKNYYVFELEPGNWFIEHISRPINDGFSAYASITMLSKATIAFEAPAGQILYLGEYTTTGVNALDQELYVNEPRLSNATSYLKNFSNIRGEPVSANVRVIAYDCPPESLFYVCDLKNLTLDINTK